MMKRYRVPRPGSKGTDPAYESRSPFTWYVRLPTTRWLFQLGRPKFKPGDGLWGLEFQHRHHRLYLDARKGIYHVRPFSVLPPEQWKGHWDCRDGVHGAEGDTCTQSYAAATKRGQGVDEGELRETQGGAAFARTVAR